MGLLTKLKNRARELKAETRALIIAYGDKRTPMAAKVLIALTVGYLLSPIDLIPDFIPVLGLLDDIIIIPVLISISIKLIPPDVLSDCRNKAKNTKVVQNKNWYMATIIIAVWLLLIYLAYHTFVKTKP